MTAIDYVAASAFSIEIIGGFYAYFELTATFVLMKSGGRIMGSYKHTIEHIVLLVLMIICNITLVFWLLSHAGVQHAWHIHITGEHFWIVIFLFGIMKIITAKHLREERKGGY